MRKLFIYPIVASLAVGVWFHGAGAQGEPPLPAPGITPASPFYIFDRLGETVEKFFTFKPGARARLEISFAAERIAEIKIMLETKGVEAKGLEVAEGRLLTHLETATSIVEKEKAAGNDVDELAKELDGVFKGPKAVLEQSFKDQDATPEVRIELGAEPHAGGGTARSELLFKKLAEIEAWKNSLETEEDATEELEDLPEVEKLEGEEWEKLDDLNGELD